MIHIRILILGIRVASLPPQNLLLCKLLERVDFVPSHLATIDGCVAKI